MWGMCGLPHGVKNDHPSGAYIIIIIDSQGLPLRAAPWAKNDRPFGAKNVLAATRFSRGAVSFLASYPRGGSPDPLRKSARNAVGQETHRAKNRTALKMGFWDDFQPINQLTK